ncbi:Bardet-Biedl syndrome 1 protein like protein (BBS1-like protein 1) [Angomonas deanei]|nr:Bardet-Biedl syndrome 1 protein like protein (BBS1-like protein 1) [Angomonas deanei]|eukprot:EPY41902.1 Bardet-Biedl syndrome 1 protein like protein (BBS1-like protein 1) [Angomonas deanei]
MSTRTKRTVIPKETKEAKPKAKKREEQFWLFAFKDSLANLSAYTNQICTADIEGDSNYKCIVADGNSKKLKIFSGTSMVKEIPLLTVPTCVCALYIHNTSKSAGVQRPVIAVAEGPFIFTYYNYQPLYRFLVPEIKIHDEEREIWELLQQGILNPADAEAQLVKLVDSGVSATARTLEFLLIDNEKERNAFIAKVANQSFKQFDSITCMTTLYESTPDRSAVGMLTFCTEHGFLYMLKDNLADILFGIKLPSTGVQMITAGCYNQEYRIIISARDGKIYNLKNGKLSTSVIQPDSLPVAIARYNNNVAVATMNNTITYFNLKGKAQHLLPVTSPVTNMDTIVDDVTGIAKALVVSFADGHLRVYVGKFLQHECNLHGPTTAMFCGKYGREDSSLLIVLRDGSFQARLLHRSAQFSENKELEMKPPPEQDVPIQVPQLSSVFTLQRRREAKHGVDMYRTYQYDLVWLKLMTARAYWAMLHNGAAFANETTAAQAGEAPVAVTEPESVDVAREEPAGANNMEVNPLLAMLNYTAVRLTGTVQGMGPVFKIKLSLQNSTKTALQDVYLVIHYQREIYKVHKHIIYLPFLVPHINYHQDILLELREGEVKGEGNPDRGDRQG